MINDSNHLLLERLSVKCICRKYQNPHDNTPAIISGRQSLITFIGTQNVSMKFHTNTKC